MFQKYKKLIVVIALFMLVGSGCFWIIKEALELVDMSGAIVCLLIFPLVTTIFTIVVVALINLLALLYLY